MKVLYQTSKELTKFGISGVIAVFSDFATYYGLNVLFPEMAEQVVGGGMFWNDVFKALGFIVGTIVTYNLNKYWTWRQNDRNNKRLMNFIALYAISFVVNVLVNRYSIIWLPDNEIALISKKFDGSMVEWIAFKTDKFFAFLFSAVGSAMVSFIGQKIWVFKTKEEQEAEGNQ